MVCPGLLWIEIVNYFAFPGLYNRYQRKLLLVPGPSLFARFVLDLPHALRLKVNLKASVTSAVMEAESRSAACLFMLPLSLDSCGILVPL